MDEKYENRILGTAMVNPADIIPNEKNWRRHPKFQKEAMESTLREIGWIQDVIINKRTGCLIDGHLRVEMALKNGETEIPVKYVDLTDEEEVKALITFDPITNMAETDRQKLDSLIESLRADAPLPGDGSEVSDMLDAQRRSFEEAVEDSMIASGVKKYDPAETEWEGMPEFNMEKQTGEFHVIVHMDSLQDLKAFAKLTGQNINPKTKSIWYPWKERRDAMALGYVSDVEE